MQVNLKIKYIVIAIFVCIAGGVNYFYIQNTFNKKVVKYSAFNKDEFVIKFRPIYNLLKQKKYVDALKEINKWQSNDISSKYEEKILNSLELLCTNKIIEYTLMLDLIDFNKNSQFESFEKRLKDKNKEYEKLYFKFGDQNYVELYKNIDINVSLARRSESHKELTFTAYYPNLEAMNNLLEKNLEKITTSLDKNYEIELDKILLIKNYQQNN